MADKFTYDFNFLLVNFEIDQNSVQHMLLDGAYIQSNPFDYVTLSSALYKPAI